MEKTAFYDISRATTTKYGKSTLFEMPDRYPVLVLRGNRRERGYDCGRLLAGRMKEFVPSFTTFVHAMFGGWAPGSDVTAEQLTYGAQAMRDFCYSNLVPAIVDSTPGIWEEYIGLYDGLRDGGSPITFDDVVMLQTIPESFSHQHHGCSNFAAWGNATVDGKLIHAVNLDQDTFGMLNKSILLLAEENDEGYDVIGPSYGMGIMHASYMNAAGMSYGEMTSTSGLEKWPQLPHYCQARLMAETASSLDEAFAISKATGGTTGWANLVSQTEKVNCAASIELNADLVGIRRPTKARPDVMFVTNHFRGYEGMEGWEGPEMVHRQLEFYISDPRYIEDCVLPENASWADMDTLDKWRKNFRCLRYEQYERKLDELHGTIDIDKAIELQSEPPIGMSDEDVPPLTLLCEPFTGEYGAKVQFASRPLQSVYTCIFKPEEQAVWLAAGEQPAQKGTFFKLTMQEAMDAAAKAR